ncbi:MAG: antibiotic biosynthesis monooxygenase [Pseudomonadota bacterium]|nr:antibiotic biosynthesis monooxygenase [Pseudomonadota bacterium]
MILRTWHGRTKREDADAYEKFTVERAGSDYPSVAGFRKFYFTRRDEGDVSHFFLVTVWDSLEAVKRFAGEEPEKAKYYPEDDRFLLEKEEHSFNHVIFHES